ncbi:MAG: hypothetical protein FWD69_07695 [Polyangiaceae bacterium]|nr:hypothetical protein [Polyangiaceae bacterium]
MRFTYVLVEEVDCWAAECQEADAIGEGITRNEAVASLRQALLERLFRPDAVAPPSEANTTSIELILLPGPPSI